MAADARMEAAVQAGEARTVEPDGFFDHVYAELTPRMERQRQAFWADREGRT